MRVTDVSAFFQQANYGRAIAAILPATNRTATRAAQSRDAFSRDPDRTTRKG